MSLGTPENSAIQKLSIIIIYLLLSPQTHGFWLGCVLFPCFLFPCFFFSCFFFVVVGIRTVSGAAIFEKSLTNFREYPANPRNLRTSSGVLGVGQFLIVSVLAGSGSFPLQETVCPTYTTFSLKSLHYLVLV